MLLRIPRGCRSAALVAAALLASVSSLVAQARTVRGLVVDSLTTRPLAGALVTAGRVTVTTAADGRFAVAVARDTVSVTVRRSGYHAFSSAAGSFPAEVHLVRAPLLLTSLSVTADAATVHGLGAGTQLGLAVTEGATVRTGGAIAVAEAMIATEGVSTSRPGSWGSKAYLRGLGGERVAILLDGNRINRACNVGMDGGLATVNPDNVERIEVLSGPGSALYGSGNVGGVINVVTRGTTDEPGTHGELRLAGSTAVPGVRAGGTLRHRSGRFAVSAAADGASYDDYRSPTGTVASSAFRDATFDLGATYGLGLAHRVDARVQRYLGRDIGYPGSGNATIPEEDRRLVSLDYGWQASRGILEGLTAKAYLQSLDHVMVMTMTRPPTMPGGPTMTMRTDATSATDTWGARLQARLRPHRAATLDAGVEYTRWDAEGTRWTERVMMGDTTTGALRTWPGVRLGDGGIFAQAAIAVGDRVDVSIGGRVDYLDRTAEDSVARHEWVPSGNAGVRVELPARFSARASLGFGYRAPDPTELYGLLLRPDGYLYLGNPALETETSRNVELSLAWETRALTASVTVFRNDIAGYITPAITGDSLGGVPIRQYRGVTQARLEGVSASLGAEAAAWLSVRATASYTSGVNRASGAPLPLIPPLEGSAAVRFSPTGFPWIEPEILAAMEQGDAAAGETATPGYAVLNVRAGWRIRRTEVAIGVENLLDRAYRRHLDPTAILRPGRNLFVRVVQGF